MDSQDSKILIASIVEVQGTINEAIANGEFKLADKLWLLQQEKGKRLKNGHYYTKPDNRRTPKTDQGDG